jgi:hypothetical protein
MLITFQGIFDIFFLLKVFHFQVCHSIFKIEHSKLNCTTKKHFLNLLSLKKEPHDDSFASYSCLFLKGIIYQVQ